MKKLSIFAVIVGYTFALSVGTLRAQSDRGAITGTVSDPSGALVQGVKVTARSLATGTPFEATSDSNGLYSVLNLPVGVYSVSFKKDGFRSVERPNITISTAQVAQLQISLPVGSTGETVTVTGDAPMLETQTSDVGTNMKAAPLQDLPFSAQGGRAVEQFAFAITPSAQGDPYFAVIGGAQGFTKEVVIDGTSQNASIQGDSIEASPTMEAVSEVQAQTSGLTAERGMTNGGVINLGLKSGTNQFHGTAFGFGHNELIDANLWDNGHLRESCLASNSGDASACGQYRKPKARFWDYGFSAGGPIIKNKTFFFGAFERFQQHDFTLGGFSQTVPTPAFLNGDFSALLGGPVLDANNNPYINPCTSQPILTGQIFDPATSQTVGGQPCASPFPGNVIDPSRISSVAKNIAAVYQKSYAPEGSALFNNNRIPSQNSPSQTPNEITIKIDHNLSDRNHISGSYIYNHRLRLLNDSGGIWAPGSTDGGALAAARNQRVISYSWRASESFAITPNLLNVVSGTYNAYWNGSVATSSAQNWPSVLGLGDGYANNFPVIDFGPAVNNVQETYIGNAWQGNWVAGTYIYGDTLSWVKGKHTFKFGGEFRAMQINSHSQNGTLHFQFSNDYTGAATQPYNSLVGFGFASMLLGGVQSASVDTPFDLYGRRKSFSFFGQDDYKVTSKLTLNLGLRWDITNPLHEKYGHWANFDPTLVDPATGTPGAIAFASSGDDTFEKNRDWKDFGPSIGAAYAATSKLVLRGAFGIYYAPLVMNYYEGVPYGFAPGYRGTDQVTQTGPGQAAFSWDGGYPGVFQPGTKDPNFFPYGTVAIDPNALTLGYSDQWNVGGQYELGKNMVLDVSYVGNRGHRLHDGGLANYRAPASQFFPLFTNGTAYDFVFDDASAAAAGVPNPYPGFAGLAYQAISPFPQVAATFGPIYAVDSPIGKSGYNALQIEFKKRTGGGLTADFSYVLSKSTGDTNSAFSEGYPYSLVQDPTHLEEAAHTLSAYDEKHVIKGYLTYDLPFGKGKRFAASSHGFVGGLVNGWTFGTLLRYNTGEPLSFFSQNYYAYPDWTVTYMNYAPGVKGSFGGHYTPPTDTNPTPASNLYFDPTKVTDPTYGQFGTGPARIDALRGFGKTYENASIIKYFSMGADARFKLQLRVEFYNIFNRHALADPVSKPGTQFGYVTGLTNDPPRQGQFGARFSW